MPKNACEPWSRVFPYAPGHCFDHDSTLPAVDPPHVIDQKHQVAPESDEFKPPRRGRLVVAGRGLMAAGTNRCRPFPRSYRDENGLLVFGETGLLVDKSRDGMALVQNSGKAHEIDWVDTKMKTNPNSPPSTPAALLPYCRDCRDLSEWPERWMGEEKDLPLGRKCGIFHAFLLPLAIRLSKRTIQNQSKYVVALREIIPS